MNSDFLDVLQKVQELQRRFTCKMNSFSVVVKYDDYYEEYLEVEIRTDNDKFFFTTYNCLYSDDYAIRIEEMKNVINQISKNGDIE